MKGTDGTWRTTLTFLEDTVVGYKHALGTWDFVEKDAACGGIGNRQLRVVAGTDGAQLVQNSGQDWRNVPPCGD